MPSSSRAKDLSRSAPIALIVTTAIEFLKRIESPQLDAIRGEFFGKVILGRYFSYTDIAVYWFAVFCCMWIDHKPIHRPHASKE